MSGDVRHFRRRFFGGFDTSDVMLYIEELAAQRNKYKSTGDRLESELKNLNAEIKRLQAELDGADQRISDIKVRSLEEASSGITTLKESYSSIRSEMETTTSTISSELGRLGSSLANLAAFLDKTSSRFSELQTLVENEKSEAITVRPPRFVI